MASISVDLLSSAWEVLVLFLVPIGGGIPAGVVLAEKRGLSWLMMCLVYLISDIVLACVFEPLMLLFIKRSHKTPWMMRLRYVLAQSTGKIVGRYGLTPGPFSLVMLTFGTDPMTGRSIAKAVGHGFVAGWTLVIMGDMLFFLVIMASTLWLNHVLGDGTWAAVIVMTAMIGIPTLIQHFKRKQSH